MPHGRPDWYNITPMIHIHASEDVNELAARLGAADVWDRRGNVVFIDNFRAGLTKWGSNVLDDNSSVTLEIRMSRLGGFLARLDAAALAADFAEIYQSVPVSLADVCGFEVGPVWANNTPEFTVYVMHDDATDIYDYAIKCEPDLPKLSYLNDAGGWTPISTSNMGDITSTIVHSVKLVIDLATREYVRCLFDGVAYSLVELGAYRSDDGGNIGLGAFMRSGKYSAGASVVDLDYGIFTINED